MTSNSRDDSDSSDEAYISGFRVPSHTSEPNKQTAFLGPNINALIVFQNQRIQKCYVVNVMHKGLSAQVVDAKKWNIMQQLHTNAKWKLFQ